MVPLFCAAYAAPHKAPQFYTDLDLQNSPPVNGKNQGLFKTFECFSSTFQGKSIFQGRQDSPVYSSTFQACANPAYFLFSIIAGAMLAVSFIFM